MGHLKQGTRIRCTALPNILDSPVIRQGVAPGRYNTPTTSILLAKVEIHIQIPVQQSLSDIDSMGEENIAENMQIIHNQAVAVNDFVNAFHRLSNIPTPKITDVNASALFKRLAHLLRDEKGRCSLQFTAPQELVIKADANQLILVLVNLLRNSFHALDGQQNGKIEVLASSSEGKVYITVRDNGPGIADEHIEHIFEPFYSTKNGGTGIGLPLSRQPPDTHGW